MTSSSRVPHIALTGAPCSGKSSALGFLKERLAVEGYRVYSVPEAATLLTQAGILFQPGEQEIAYQLAVCRLQWSLEGNIAALAAARDRPTKEKSLLISDRGILDNKGYMDAQTWEQVLSKLLLCDGDQAVSPSYSDKNRLLMTDDKLLERYSGVVHLVTAADGALEFYKSGKTTDDLGIPVVRSETPEEAIVLDEEMWKVLERHPQHYRISNDGTFPEKMEATAKAILSILGALA